MKALPAVFALLCALLGAPALACDATTPCDVASGRYFVRAPASWDGKSALPVAVYFHGYRSSAVQTMADAALGEALSRAGVLLAAADGRDGAWSIPGRLSTGRDDVAYTRDLLADLRRRFPVDDRRLIATGFSAGGFMVWQIACAAGDLFAAYAPVAGAFLDPVPDFCPTGPVSLRHVHGTADTVVPTSGRWIANGKVRQGDLFQSVARLRETDGCPQVPPRREQRGSNACEIWPADACASRREIQLCLNGGGHVLDPAWIVEAVEWAGSLAGPAGR